MQSTDLYVYFLDLFFGMNILQYMIIWIYNRKKERDLFQQVTYVMNFDIKKTYTFFFEKNLYLIILTRLKPMIFIDKEKYMYIRIL